MEEKKVHNQIPGVIEDPRSPEEKSRDYNHKELYSASPVTWVEKDPKDWKSYSIRDQNGSGSCVAQGSSKAIEVYSGQIMSATPIFSRRSNRPSTGMWLQNAGDIIKKQGTTTEVLCHSQKMSDDQMDATVLPSTPLKIDGYAFVNKDFDTVASALDIHGALIVTFQSNYTEWKDVPVVTGSPAWGHCVAIVDRFMYKGVKYFLIEDSWGKATSIGNGGQRLITKEFFDARCTGIMYILPYQPPHSEKPKYHFTTPLTYSNSIKKDVIALQDCLKFAGFFPANVESTGRFLNATAHSVVKYQIAHGINDYSNETDMTRVRVGPKTIALLNTEFA